MTKNIGNAKLTPKLQIILFYRPSIRLHKLVHEYQEEFHFYEQSAQIAMTVMKINLPVKTA